MRRVSLICFGMAFSLPVLIWLSVALPPEMRKATLPAAHYMDLVARDGLLDWMISQRRWKLSLANDPRCTAMRVVIIGSSRLYEVDRNVLGSDEDVCNLSVPGLEPRAFDRMTRALPAVRDARIAYVGLDHFFFWRGNIPEDSMSDLNALIPMQVSGVFEAFGQLSGPVVSGVLSEIGRRPVDSFEYPKRGVYPDGHVFAVRYYEGKASGLVRTIHDKDIAAAVRATLPTSASIDERNVGVLNRGLRRLREKGYEVRLFWNPLVPAYLAGARRNNAALFQQAILSVGRLIGEGGVARYAGAGDKLDASSFGCSERDYIDAILSMSTACTASSPRCSGALVGRLRRCRPRS